MQQTEFIVIFSHILPFWKNFEKMKKKPGDIIVLQKCTKNHVHMLYCSWDMAQDGCNCYFSFWAICWKIKIKKKKKMKTTPGDIIILGKCTINDVWFLRYEAWQTESFIILAHFLPFHPTNNSKKKKKKENFEKMKKKPGDIILHKCTKNLIICYTAPEIWCVTDVIIFHFGLVLPFYPPNSPKYQNLKKWEKPEITSFYRCVLKIMIRWCRVPEIWCALDRRVDRKSDI